MHSKILYAIVFLFGIATSCNQSSKVKTDSFLNVIAGFENENNSEVSSLDLELVNVDTLSSNRTCAFLASQISKRAEVYLRSTGASDLVDSLMNKELDMFANCQLEDSQYFMVQYKFKLDDTIWFVVLSEKDSIVYYSQYRN